MVMLSMQPKVYERMFEERGVALDALKCGRSVRENIAKIMDEGIAREAIMKVAESRERDGMMFLCMIDDSSSFPCLITRDGDLRIPESNIQFSEIIGAVTPQGQKVGEYIAETLRFHLLWKLRALVCPEAKDVEVAPGEKKKITRSPSVPGTIERIRIKKFPRSMESEPRAESPNEHEQERVRGSVAAHPVIGHRRKLPAGFYASPGAIAEAVANDIELDFVMVDGKRMYTETFVGKYNTGKGPAPLAIKAEF